MTRDNLYWLSQDQVALFKTFRGTASSCKQTINHVVPRIKQPIPKYPQCVGRYIGGEREEKRGWKCIGRYIGGEREEQVKVVLALGASYNEEGRPLFIA
ncbi:hypothetical protein Lal_00027463 [Lupinus albus]|nr:hypothetical protein Lal_00027463 [Lupinus albus]